MATRTNPQEARRISPHALSQRIAQGEAVVAVDVRTADARLLHPVQIPNSRWLPLAEVVEQADTLPHESLIATYCT